MRYTEDHFLTDSQAAEKSAAVRLCVPKYQDVPTYERLLELFKTHGFKTETRTEHVAYPSGQYSVDYLVITRADFRQQYDLDRVRLHPCICWTELVAAFSIPKSFHWKAPARPEGCEDCPDNGKCPICGRMPQTP